MNLCFVCRKYDKTDKINAMVVEWIDRLAQDRRVGEVFVLTLEPAVSKPSKTNIKLLPHSRGRNRVHTLSRFYRSVMAVRARVDGFFTWQGGPYQALLWPFRMPVFQWKAHQEVSRFQNFSTTWCTDVVFTSTSRSYPGGGRVEVVGHGINTHMFRPMEGVRKKWDFITVGRVNPVKGIHRMVMAIGGLNRLIKPKRPHSLCVQGVALNEVDRAYQRFCSRLARDQAVPAAFLKPIHHDKMPARLNQARVYLSFSTFYSALDRAVLEAQACGLDVVSTNECVKVDRRCCWVGGGLKEWVLALKKSLKDPWTHRGHVVRKHSLETFWDRVLPIMESVVNSEKRR